MSGDGFSSIQARIAALNLNQVGHPPNSPPPSYDQAVTEQPRAKRPPPPLPNRPPRPTANNTSTTNGAGPAVNDLPPQLPTRPSRPTSTTNGSHSNGVKKVVPPLPSRPPRPSGASTTSLPYEEQVTSPTISVTSFNSATSYDDEDRPRLPPRRSTKPDTPKLPPRRPSAQSTDDKRLSSASHGRRPSLESVASNISGVSNGSRRRVLAPDYDAASLPPLPQRRPTEPVEDDKPRLPLRPTASSPSVPSFPRSRNEVKPPPLPGRPSLPTRPAAVPSHVSDDGAPPPVPLSSRPDLASIQASKPKPGSASGCLICRDFSAPDAHAARFPRQSIPSQDVHWLARELTAPFPSQTDKARAIFTWLHHNIVYDVQGFFSGNIKRSTPASTISSGLAVCEGYAGLFNALAASAGVESIVVTGHGKGVGYNSPDRNNLPPPNPTGHAWNAFRLDDGQWKLIDACWGAGALSCGTQQYEQRFAPERFTQSNEHFGLDHFPDDQRYFFRADGRALSWTKYVLFDADFPQVCGGIETEGWSKQSITPASKTIAVSGRATQQTFRFSITKICAHWDGERNGKGKQYLPFLEFPGRGEKQQRPLQFDGFTWWIDVARSELGPPGEEVKLIYMWKLDNEEARGLTARGYERWQAENRAKSWCWQQMVTWKLV